jgi:probable deoxyuridine 5'-triphosphate nucleotidohydrolase yncF
MKAKQIKVKYLREYMNRIHLIKNGDWIDLRTGVDVFMKKGDFLLIPLGVAIQLPENTEALLIPRSSTFKKYGIIQANSVGLIDESYCGEQDEWMFPAYATKDTIIPKNTRICQFRIQEHQPAVTIRVVEHLSGTNRGGFGSTGER